MLKICVKDFFKEFVTCHLLKFFFKAWWKLLSFTEANLVIARAPFAFGGRLDDQ